MSRHHLGNEAGRQDLQRALLPSFELAPQYLV
jgi:hypothetical protein